eukprot:SAG22_NODE_1244_length_5021_cov_16.855547_6_plen_158_part_00
MVIVEDSETANGQEHDRGMTSAPANGPGADVSGKDPDGPQPPVSGSGSNQLTAPEGKVSRGGAAPEAAAEEPAEQDEEMAARARGIERLGRPVEPARQGEPPMPVVTATAVKGGKSSDEDSTGGNVYRNAPAPLPKRQQQPAQQQTKPDHFPESSEE